MNLIPREGGNRFSGTVFLSEAGKWSQGDNLDRRTAQSANLDHKESRPDWCATGTRALRSAAQSCRTACGSSAPGARQRHDEQRARQQHDDLPQPERRGEPRNSSIYAAGPFDGPRYSATSARQVAFRLTGQLTPRNKLGFYHDYNWRNSGARRNSNDDGLPAARRGLDRATAGSSLARLKPAQAGMAGRRSSSSPTPRP